MPHKCSVPVVDSLNFDSLRDPWKPKNLTNPSQALGYNPSSNGQQSQMLFFFVLRRGMMACDRIRNRHGSG